MRILGRRGSKKKRKKKGKDMPRWHRMGKRKEEEMLGGQKAGAAYEGEPPAQLTWRAGRNVTSWGHGGSLPYDL